MTEQLSLFNVPPKVTLKISWTDLLGTKATDMPDALRRQRWEQWLALSSDYGREYWTDTEGCEGCKHLDGNWCKLQELPATVNPLLTIHGGMIGMACMGAGYEPVPLASGREGER